MSDKPYPYCFRRSLRVGLRLMKERRRIRDDAIRNSPMRMRAGDILACRLRSRNNVSVYWYIFRESKHGFLIRVTKQRFALSSQAFDWMIAFVLKKEFFKETVE